MGVASPPQPTDDVAAPAATAQPGSAARSARAERPVPSRVQESASDRARRRDRHERFRLALEILTLAALLYYAYQARLQAVATKDAADAALKSAGTAERQFVASERPWVKLEAVVPRSLTYNQDGAAELALHFVVGNVGNTPSGSTNIEAIAYLLDSPTRSHDYIAEQKKFCDRLKDDDPNPHELGFTVFPNDRLSENISLTIDRKEIDDSIAVLRALTKKDIDPSTMTILPVIVGCIDYRFAVDPEKHHQTPFIFRVFRKGTEIGPAHALYAHQSYEASELELEPWIQAGSNAD